MVDRDKGEHLPNLREGRQPPHPSWLPRQRRGTTPQMVGRYPDFDVLDAVGTWDHATRDVVLARLTPPGPLQFFRHDEESALRALCDVATAQDAEPRIPVAESVDAKLAAGRLDGYQYDTMPDDRETWHRVLAGLDHTALERHRVPFASCSAAQQEEIVGALAEGSLSGGPWDQLDVVRAWAWNESGFGGPAYPRGFMRTGSTSVLEPFERPGATAEDAARVVAEHPEELSG